MKARQFVDPLTGLPLNAKQRVRTVRPSRVGAEPRPERVDSAAAPDDSATVAQILAWVGTDTDRATLMLVKEESGRRRVTLIEGLRARLNAAGALDDKVDTDTTGRDGYADGHQGDNDTDDAQEA